MKCNGTERVWSFYDEVKGGWGVLIPCPGCEDCRCPDCEGGLTWSGRDWEKFKACRTCNGTGRKLCEPNR